MICLCTTWVFYDVWVLRHRSMDTKSTQYFNQYKNMLHGKLNDINVKFIRYQYWYTRCVFRQLMYFQFCSGLKILKTRKKPQTECREIEPNPSKDRAMHERDIPSFWNEFIKFIFSGLLNSYPHFQASIAALSH
jgi:hypothetical protein